MTLRKMLALILSLLCLAGCGRQEARPTPSAPAPSASVVRYLTFEQALAACTDLLQGQFVARHDRGSWRELEFRVTQRLKGATRADTIFVDDTTAQAYVPGQEYLLVLERQVSVYQQHDRYIALCSLYLPLAVPGDSKLGTQP